MSGHTARKPWRTARIDFCPIAFPSEVGTGSRKGTRQYKRPLCYKGAAAGRPFAWCRAPDAAQRGSGALLIRGPWLHNESVMGPGSAEQREERCTASGTRAHLLPLSHKGRREGQNMPEQILPTVAESAMRGLACKCPRCGRGKLYAGFLNLRPNCEACGLDYTFIDTGDGPAIFIKIGRAHV